MAKAEKIALWMRTRLTSAGARGFVVGLSGGVDSAVVARLAQLAAPGGILAVMMPCHSDPRDERDAQAVSDYFSLPTSRVDLSPAYDALIASTNTAISGAGYTGAADQGGGRVPEANVKARLRMTTLYYMANGLNYLVAGTGNRSELAIGYFTKFGDGGADLLPIGHLLKREVREMARELRVPASVIDRAPSAGLWPGQTDEEEMGFTYTELERYLEEGPQAVAPALAMRIERLTRLTDHKRQLPVTPEA